MTIEKDQGITTILIDKDNNSGHRLTVSSAFSDNTGHLDAFGRLRVSNPEGLFDSQLRFDDLPLLWNEKITDTSGTAVATYLGAESTKLLTVGTDDTIIRQTKSYYRYQPGKSQFILMTFVLAIVESGLTQRVGYFDAEDGLFLETSGTAIRFVRRTSTSGSIVDNVIEKADWNIDKLDGTGASGITLDAATAQILVIDMEWFGTGRVRYGFIIDGQIIYAHQILNANVLNVVYMKTATLPARYEISWTGSGTKSMKASCTMIASEGGATAPTGQVFSKGNNSNLITVSASFIPLVSIRPKALYGGSANRTLFNFEAARIFSEDNPAHYHIVYGASLDNASWVDVDSNYSAAQFDLSAGAASGGVVVDEGYISAGGVGINSVAGTSDRSLLGKLPLALDIDGNHPTSPLSDVFTIQALRVGGTNTDMGAAIVWEETR